MKQIFCSYVSVAAFIIFSTEPGFAATLPTAQTSANAPGSSAAQLEQRRQNAEALIDKKNSLLTSASSTDQPVLVDQPPAVVHVFLYPDGKIKSTGTSYGNSSIAFDYQYNSSGMLTQITQTNFGSMYKQTVISGFGLDSRGHYALFLEKNNYAVKFSFFAYYHRDFKLQLLV